MAYNYTKETCDRCGITKAQRNLKAPMSTGINHPEYCYTKSFSLGGNGEVLCPECAREKKLEQLFRVMDARDNRKRP
jgi:hypothetical protein